MPSTRSTRNNISKARRALDRPTGTRSVTRAKREIAGKYEGRMPSSKSKSAYQPGKTLVREKENRDTACRAMFGEEFEYDPSAPFGEYSSLLRFKKKAGKYAEFSPNDCVKQVTPSSKRDRLDAYYLEANTPWKCKQVNGIWSGKPVSKSSAERVGACYTSVGGARCASQEIPANVKRGLHKTSAFITTGDVMVARKRCLASGCAYLRTGECVDSAIVESFLGDRKKKASQKLTRQMQATILRRKLAKRIQSKKNQARKKKASETLTRQIQSTILRRKLTKRIQRKRNLARKVVNKMKATTQKKKQERKSAVGKISNAWKAYKTMRNLVGALPADFPKDLRSPEFQKTLERYMKGNMAAFPKPYTTPDVTGNQCVPKKGGTEQQGSPKLNVNQAIVYALAMVLREGPNRGFLSWSSTGSGKTIASACVMDVFWKTDKQIVFCTSKEALASNDPGKLASLMRTFFNRRITRADMTRRVTFVTFAQLCHRLGLHRSVKNPSPDMLTNAVLVMDEVQNLLNPIPSLAKEHQSLERFLQSKSKANKTAKVVILSATPGSSPGEVVRLLNLVRDRDEPVLTAPDPTKASDMQAFRQAVRGLVQYYDTNNDPSRFPIVERVPPYSLGMSLKQYQTYSEAHGKSNPQAALGKRYMVQPRRYASMMFDRAKGMSLAEFSSKLPKLLENLERHSKEKHWVYSAFYERTRGFGYGVAGISKALLEQGYEQLTPPMARKMLSKGLTEKKRFCVLTTTEMANSIRDVADLVKVYNSEENLQGKVCHVMLASQNFNEGVDLRAVRHVHLFEPLISEAMVQQAVGRARRFCSHAQYDNMASWTVKVHEYISTRPMTVKVANTRNIDSRMDLATSARARAEKGLEDIKGKRDKDSQTLRAALKAEVASAKELQARLKKEKKTAQAFNMSVETTADQIVRDRAMLKAQEMDALLQALREASVDCRFLKPFHTGSMRIPLKCAD